MPWRISTAQAEPVRFFDFYGMRLALPATEAPGAAPANAFYRELPEAFAARWQGSAGNNIIHYMQDMKDSLQLNDWLYFKMLESAGRRLYGPDSLNAYKATMAQWIILARSGYRCRLVFDNKRPYLFVKTDETVYELPTIELDGATYIEPGFAAAPHPLVSGNKYFSRELYDGGGLDFSFQLQAVPWWAQAPGGYRTLQFNSGEYDFTLRLPYNNRWMRVMKDYPQMPPAEAARFPLSPALAEALYRQLALPLQHMSREEQVRVFMSFTRTAFVYKTDQEAWGRENLIFLPEQTLIYPFSDCEDRSILLSWLCANMLDLPNVFVTYPGHISLAVALPGDKSYAKQLKVGGRKYTLCEATGPQDYLPIGEEAPDMAGTVFSLLEE